MKTPRFVLLILSLTGVVTLAGCSKPNGSVKTAPGDIEYYTCTMHPSVRSQDPEGKCPICGMDLVPVKKADNAAKTVGAGAVSDGQPHEFTIPVERQQMIGVTFATVEMRPLRRTVRAVGFVSATTAGHWDYVARVDGYIHNLKVGAPGEVVAKDQVLMDLYSPDLVSTENEYIDLVQMRDNGRRAANSAEALDAERLLAGARARLRQWNISDAQIDSIEKAGKADDYLLLNSPFDGVIEEVPVHQGRHVVPGDHLVDIVDLSSVWVWAEFYENEWPLLKPGLAVTITSSAIPSLSVPGRVSVVDPFVDTSKRTGRVRIDVENARSRLRPGAYVDVTLALDEGEGLVVPVDAVLPTGEHSIVFVDKGGGRLEPRFVQIGGAFGEVCRVTGGLRVGERVVSSANFLVDAEAKVQGALKSW